MGSTVTSLIYASFTFLLFAIEASIMSVALNLVFGMPMWVAFLITGLAFLLIGGLIAAGGVGRVKQASLKPEVTTQTLKEDGRWASETMRVVRSKTRANA